MSATYALCFELQSFGLLDPQTQREVVQHLCNAITSANVGFLKAYHAPRLYESGVRYYQDSDRIEKQWWDIPAVLEHRRGDCKALACYRAAELRIMGDRASPFVYLDHVDADGVVHFHVVVDRGSRGREDPSRVLGMV